MSQICIPNEKIMNQKCPLTFNRHNSHTPSLWVWTVLPGAANRANFTQTRRSGHQDFPKPGTCLRPNECLQIEAFSRIKPWRIYWICFPDLHRNSIKTGAFPLLDLTGAGYFPQSRTTGTALSIALPDAETVEIFGGQSAILHLRDERGLPDSANIFFLK